MALNLLDIDCASQEWFQDWIGCRFFEMEDEFLAQISYPWGKLETEQPCDSKNLVGEAPSIGVMLTNSKIRFVIEKAIHHMRCVACGSTNHFDAVRTILIGKMGVKADSRLCPITEIHLCYWAAPSAHFEPLAIRGSSFALAPGGALPLTLSISNAFFER